MELTLIPTLPLELINPFAPPDWRWKAAEAIVRGEKSMRHYSMDADVVDAVSHQRAHARHKLRNAVALIDEASCIYRDSSSLSRWEIEARIVAGQSDAEIARAIEVPNEVICRYRALFFHVPPRARDYIRLNVIGGGPRRGFWNREVPQFWAWSAMGGGPIVLESLMESFRRALPRGARPQLSVYLRANSPAVPSIQSYVAGAVLPNKPAWKDWFFEIRARFIEIKSMTDSASRSLQSESLRWEVIRAGRAVLAGSKEPRATSKRTRKPKRARNSGSVGPEGAVETGSDHSISSGSLSAQMQELLKDL